MKKENIKVIVAIVIVAILTLGITGTFAYFTYNDKQTTANTFKSGCLEISIENVTNALNLNNQKPITDVEGLKSEGYEFKIKNTCTTKERYEINLETLTESTLKADYVRVSLSSDTFDNIITTLSENKTRAYHSSDASTSYNLYTGEIEGEQTKTFKLREWLEYNTTVEQGSNKIYKSKINVITNPDLVLDNNFKEIKHENEERTITVSNISGTTYKYCTTSDAECTPSTTQSITDNKVIYTLENKSNDQIICSNIDDSKTICSDVIIKKKITMKEQILADNGSPKAMPSITGPACDANTNNSSHSSGSCTMQDKGIYTTTDEKGTSYVYRGTVDNNWVKFGKDSSNKDMWWRIIRVNGDGSVRMIYAGAGTVSEVTDSAGKWTKTATDTDTSVAHALNKETFGPKVTSQSDCVGNKWSNNACYNDNKFVGYMFHGNTSTASTSYDDAHSMSNTGTITNSNVKKVLDEWYKQNLSDETEHISYTAGFCGDRSSSTSETGPFAKTGGYGTQVTYYGAYNRNRTNKTPSLECTNKSNDLYTTPEDTNEGNKKLTYPIGLITADEVTLAGGYYGSSNYGYWLYTGTYYWTMSPSDFSGAYAYVFYVTSYGNLNGGSVNGANGVRPVINLSADTTFAEGGAGTTSNPYVPT